MLAKAETFILINANCLEQEESLLFRIPPQVKVKTILGIESILPVAYVGDFITYIK